VSLRALIVDDEPLGRRAIRRALRHHPDVEVIGEAGDGQAAVGAIAAQQPDLLFLDIQMPEMGGFEVVSRVGVENMPATIFVTAYDRYALEAFEANALDYLLKPFGRPRFDRALGRARERVAANRNADRSRQMMRMMEGLAGRAHYLDRFPVSEGGRIVFVKARKIQWIEAAGNYARLHTAGRSHDLRETLTNLEGKLDPARFLRIHRSAMVNIEFVREVHPWFHGYHLVLLENGEKLRMSRYQRDVAAKLGLNPPKRSEK
jgi:two-component system LytT family response regulator